MKSQKEDDSWLGALDDSGDDEEDHLPVPASPARVVIGLIMFVSGMLILITLNETWFKWVGVGFLLLSYPVMLKWPDRK